MSNKIVVFYRLLKYICSLCHPVFSIGIAKIIKSILQLFSNFGTNKKQWTKIK